MLYFPRGTIHQVRIIHLHPSLLIVVCNYFKACSLPDTHSLHVTVSAAQRNSWGDLLEKVRVTPENDNEYYLFSPSSSLHFLSLSNTFSPIVDTNGPIHCCRTRQRIQRIFTNRLYELHGDCTLF